MGLIVYLISLAVDIYVGIIIIQVVVHWLIAFDVLKTNSPQARNLLDLMKRLTDPIYRLLQKYIPPIGGIDLTPIVAIIGLNLLKNILIGVLI